MAKRFQPYRPRVFISYAARGTDAETAQALREALVGHKVRVPSWRDMEEIPPGSRAIREIQVGIAQCDFFLLLVSPRSVLESRWCPRELSRADRLQKIIVPLILETVEPENWPLELEGAQWIDVQRGLAKAMPQLLTLLGVTVAAGIAVLDPADRDDRRMRALAYAHTRFESMGAAYSWNVRQILSDFGKESMETERAIRIVEKVRKARIGTCIEASQALLRAWEAPGKIPDKRRTPQSARGQTSPQRRSRRSFAEPFARHHLALYVVGHESNRSFREHLDSRLLLGPRSYTTTPFPKSSEMERPTPWQCAVSRNFCGTALPASR